MSAWPLAFGFLLGAVIVSQGTIIAVLRTLAMARARENTLLKLLGAAGDPAQSAKLLLDYDRMLELHVQYLRQPLWWRMLHRVPT